MDASKYVNNLINVQKFEENKELQGKLVIIGVVEEQIQNENKLLLCFDMMEDRLALNNTNTKALIAVLGSDTDLWKGAAVQLEVKSVMYGTDMTKGLRFKTVIKAK